jgi:hypothetical protein
MTERVISKVLVGHEDLLLGQGSVSQTRQGLATDITAVDVSFIFTTLIEVKRLDTTKYKHITLDNGVRQLLYRYDSTSTDTADDYKYIAPNEGSGRWVLYKDFTSLIYDDYDELREALTNELPKVGQLITSVSPYGVFKVVEAGGTEYEDNGGTTLVANESTSTTGMLVAVIQSKVDITTFGAHPDNDASTNATAIQAAFDWAGSIKASLYAELPGTYQYDETLLIDAPFTFLGSGPESIVFEATHTSGNALELGTNSPPNGLFMRGFQVTGPQSLDYLWAVNKNSGSDVANCHFQDILLLGGSGDLSCRGVLSGFHTTSMYERFIILSTDVCWQAVSQTNNIHLNSCRFQSSNQWFTALTCEGIQFSSPVFQNQAVDTEYNHSFTLRQSSVMMINPYFENIYSDHLGSVGASSDTVDSMLSILGGVGPGAKMIEYRNENLDHFIKVEGMRIAPEGYAAFDEDETYDYGEQVTDDDRYWISAVDGNQGNTPSTDDGTYWVQDAGNTIGIISHDSGYYTLPPRSAVVANIRDKQRYLGGRIVMEYKADNRRYNNVDFCQDSSTRLLGSNFVSLERAAGIAHGIQLVKNQVYTLMIAMLREDSDSWITLQMLDGGSGGSEAENLSISNLVPIDQYGQEFDLKYAPFKARGDYLNFLMAGSKVFKYAYVGIIEGLQFPKVDIGAMRERLSTAEPTFTGEYGDIVFDRYPTTGDRLGWMYADDDDWKDLANL